MLVELGLPLLAAEKTLTTTAAEKQAKVERKKEATSLQSLHNNLMRALIYFFIYKIKLLYWFIFYPLNKFLWL